MRKHTTIDLDADLVREAADVLGTTRTTDTIHAALAEVVNQRRRLSLLSIDNTLSWPTSRTSGRTGSPNGRSPTGPTSANDRARGHQRPDPREARSRDRSTPRGPIRLGEIATCDVVELEYLMGARNATDYDAIVEALGGFKRLGLSRPTGPARARSIGHLAAQGPGYQRSVRIPDLLIAAVAERHGVAVLHYDGDYDRIASVTGQPTRWVVPRGSPA